MKMKTVKKNCIVKRKQIKTILILIALFYCRALSYGQNLVQNPGFENLIDPWIVFSTTGSPSVFSFDYGNYHSGSVSLLMQNTSADTSFLVQIVPVTAGHRYFCEFWVNASSMEKYMLPFIRFRKDTVAVYDTYFCPNGNTPGWQRFTSRVIAPDSSDNIVFFFALYGAGTLNIDDVSLVELSDSAYSTFTVQTNQFSGNFRKLFSANGIGPGNNMQPFNHIQKVQELGVDYIRTHDYMIAFDHSVIFPDTSADPLDPAAYNFHTTDSCVADIINAGVKVFYRLGQSYDINHIHNQPPASIEKWAQVCIQVIKHYNEGWNNGFYYNITDFEIWNEPDIRDFWTGSVDEYIKLYRTTALKIKNYNPALKVGGPAISNVFNESFINVFLDSVSTYNIPLDFFSYHLYFFYNPYYFKIVNGYVRNKLDLSGLTNTTLINSEWNSYMFSFETYSEWGMDDALNAASAAGAMIYMQESTIDKFFRYALDNYWFGLVNWYDQWRYSGHSMRAMCQTMDNGQRLPASGGDTLGTAVIASASPFLDEIQIIVTDNSSPAAGYTLNLAGLEPSHIYPYRIYRIDSVNKYFLIQTGVVSETMPVISTGVQPPYTDHIILDKLVAAGHSELSGGLYLFPNPSQGIFFISSFGHGSEKVVIEITDITGKIVTKWPEVILTGLDEFRLNDSAPSVYFVNIYREDGGKNIFKLIINDVY